MKKKTITILGIIVLAIIAGSFWFLQRGDVQEGNINNDISSKVKVRNEQDNGNVEKEKQEEFNQEKKIEFGINDSQLKYNTEGNIDVSKWKVLDMLVKLEYPESWYKVDFGISNVKILKDNFDVKQVYIQGTGFGAPFDIDETNGKSMDKLLMDAVRYSIDSTEKYVKKYNGICQKNKVDEFNIYMKCKYKKDDRINILFERTFIHYKIDGSGEKTGGSAGLNVEIGNLETLEKNKKVINEILRSAHIEQILGDNSLVLDGMYLK